MAGGECIGAEFAREAKEVAEFHRLIAAHAGHRRLAADVAGDEVLDHRFAEPSLVVEHVVRDFKPRRHATRIKDVGAGAAGAR